MIEDELARVLDRFDNFSPNSHNLLTGLWI